jgi:hypothetical protein
MSAGAEQESVGIVLDNRRKRILGFCQMFFSKSRVNLTVAYPEEVRWLGSKDFITLAILACHLVMVVGVQAWLGSVE